METQQPLGGDASPGMLPAADAMDTSGGQPSAHGRDKEHEIDWMLAEEEEINNLINEQYNGYLQQATQDYPPTEYRDEGNWPSLEAASVYGSDDELDDIFRELDAPVNHIYHGTTSEDAMDTSGL